MPRAICSRERERRRISLRLRCRCPDPPEPKTPSGRHRAIRASSERHLRSPGKSIHPCQPGRELGRRSGVGSRGASRAQSVRRVEAEFPVWDQKPRSMTTIHPMLCVIPARGGSKGLPGKNIRPLGGLPLISHSIRCAALCPAIDRCVVSTDSEEIAAVARAHGGNTPFSRPPELATDTTPMLSVLQHALRTMEELDGRRYEALLLLDPTSPGRLPSDIALAGTLLESDPIADGVVGVSRPEFNPFWHCVIEKDGYAGAAHRRRSHAMHDVRTSLTCFALTQASTFGVGTSCLPTMNHGWRVGCACWRCPRRGPSTLTMLTSSRGQN